MLPDRVSNPGPLTYESGVPPIALRGPATFSNISVITEGIYLKPRLVVYFQKGNSYQ